MDILCLDLEGVLVPEVWTNVAIATGLAALKLTTKDVADYDELMKHRLNALNENNIRFADIEAVVEKTNPLPGAIEFIEWLGPRWQFAIVSDTYYDFARPMMRKLGWPMLLCHRLIVDAKDRVVDYKIRQKDPKRQVVKAFKALQYKVVAAGDSYNDISMLEEADAGALFCPGEKVVADFPQYPIMNNYEEFKVLLTKIQEQWR